jgi:hypothetical protein
MIQKKDRDKRKTRKSDALKRRDPINSQLGDIMDTLYQKLNKKLDTLIRQ